MSSDMRSDLSSEVLPEALAPRPAEISADEQDVARQIRKHLEEVLNRSKKPEDLESSLYDDVARLMMMKREASDLYSSERGEILTGVEGSEDIIYKTYKLPNIDAKLGELVRKIQKLETIDKFITEQTKLTPSSERSNPVETREMRSKLKALLYILMKHKISLDSLSLSAGTVTPEMNSGANFITVEIPRLKRTIQICDEEGNVLYIFKSAKIKATKLNTLTRGEKNDWLTGHKGDGERIAYPVNWADRIEKILFGEKPVKK